jgi:DivIVA domain-containing protein
MAIDVSPNFTVALRGYDKDQVDHYLESVSERTSQTDDQLYEMQEQTRYFESEHARLAARVDELEEAIQSETPHTVAALGQRMMLILSAAEEGATDAISQAEARADYLVSEAEREADTIRRQAEMFAAQASETLAGAQRQAEALAERLEAEARGRAASIIGEAQVRAQRRHDQIETWAQDVIARTQADQIKLSEEFAKVRRHHESAVHALLGERDDAIAALRSLQGSLNRAIERVPSNEPAPPAIVLGPAPAIAAERAQQRAEHSGQHVIVVPSVEVSAHSDDDAEPASDESDAAASGDDGGHFAG